MSKFSGVYCVEMFLQQLWKISKIEIISSHFTAVILLPRSALWDTYTWQSPGTLDKKTHTHMCFHSPHPLSTFLELCFSPDFIYPLSSSSPLPPHSPLTPLLFQAFLMFYSSRICCRAPFYLLDPCLLSVIPAFVLCGMVFCFSPVKQKELVLFFGMSAGTHRGY